VEETAAAALDGRLYVVGGFDAAGNDLSTTFVFDGRRWSAGPRLPVALDHAAAVVLEHRLYVVGGFTNGVTSDRTFMLSPSGRSWITAARLRHARGALALASVGGSIFALGGKDSTGVELGPIEVYRPSAHRWIDAAMLPLPRDHLSGFSYRGWACVAGGRSPNTARVDCYDPARRRWHRLPDLPAATSGAGAAVLGAEVIVGGGELAAGDRKRDALSARLMNGRWIRDTMLVPRHGIEFAVIRGRIWACGGATAPGLHPTRTCTSIG
jgi:N-acetylneuraminic acid mutarotase